VVSKLDVFQHNAMHTILEKINCGELRR